MTVVNVYISSRGYTLDNHRAACMWIARERRNVGAKGPSLSTRHKAPINKHERQNNTIQGFLTNVVFHVVLCERDVTQTNGGIPIGFAINISFQPCFHLI